MKRKTTFVIVAMVLAVGGLWQKGHAAEKALNTIPPSLAKPVTAAMVGHKEKTLFLVDVRPMADFNQYHIAGSLNIALHAIKTKSFLKSKPLVLINNGYTVGPLAHTCQQLNQAGFKATVLAGGLLAWKAKGGRLAGDPFAQNEINHIFAQQFYQEQYYNHQIVIDASAKPDKHSQPLTPGARHINLLKSKQAGAAIKKLLLAKDVSPFASVVIYTATGKENDLIQRKLAKEGFQQAFFLQGGQHAYETYLKQLVLAHKPKKERQMSTGGCKSCTQER
jgi:rhodanese-related sulfurtransferase